METYEAYLGRTVSTRQSTKGQTIYLLFFGRRKDGAIFFNGGYSPNRLEIITEDIAGYAGEKEIAIIQPPFNFCRKDFINDDIFDHAIERAEGLEKLTDEELTQLQKLLTP